LHLLAERRHRSWSLKDLVYYLRLYLLAADSRDDVPSGPTTNKVLYLRDTEGCVKMGEMDLPV
jgi:hypothetical protein